MTKLLSKVNRNIGTLVGIFSQAPNVNIFVSIYVRKEAVLSFQIEETQATIDDILDPKPEENTKQVVIFTNEYIVDFMTKLTYNILKGGGAMLNFGLIGKRFSELRNRNGFTQSQIASFLEVDQSYISKCEKNERQFSIDVLERAAELFGCTVDYFGNESCEFEQIPIALRAKNITTEDLSTIAAMNKIALNLRFMESLLEEE